MGAIISNATTFLSHYLSYKNVSTDFPSLAKLTVTGAATITPTTSLDSVTQGTYMGANQKLFVLVDSVTDIAQEMQIYLKDAVTPANNKGIVNMPITSGGTLYTSQPVITFAGSPVWTVPFAGYCVISGGVIISVVITCPGNASTLPTLTAAATTLVGGGGSGAVVGLLVAGIAVATLDSHAGIDAIYPFNSGAVNGFDIVNVWAANSVLYSVFNGTPNVALQILAVNDTNWLDLGQNFNEGVTFTKGVMAAPVARGWVATDHSVRVRATNQFSIKQLYSSMLEGIGILRGKQILIKDECHPDGGANFKELHYITCAQVENAALEIGAGGGNAGTDSITASGYFKRQYTWTADPTILATQL